MGVAEDRGDKRGGDKSTPWGPGDFEGVLTEGGSNKEVLEVCEDGWVSVVGEEECKGVSQTGGDRLEEVLQAGDSCGYVCCN